jgi:transmembrane sensor
MEKELLNRYIANTCSEAELKEIIEWFMEKAGSESGKVILHKIWEDNNDHQDTGADLDAILNRIHHQINILRTEQKMDAAGESLIGYNRKRIFLKRIRNIAAILLIPVLGFSLYMVFDRQRGQGNQSVATPEYEVTASMDAITKVSLPDGSMVWLNHGSTLRYPAVFKNDSRQVELTGEGYFSVGHNPEVPFVVSTGDIKVVARGTEFNLMAYPGEGNIETSLVNGMVDLIKIRKNGEDQYLMQMKPSELASFYLATNKMVVSQVTDDRCWSWKDGKLIFINECMGVAVRKLSRWFNVEIEIRDKKLLDLSYTATFVNESLSQVMELMAMATPIRYSIAERREISEGLYSKRKVIIRSGNK